MMPRCSHRAVLLQRGIWACCLACFFVTSGGAPVPGRIPHRHRAPGFEGGRAALPFDHRHAFGGFATARMSSSAGLQNDEDDDADEEWKQALLHTTNKGGLPRVPAPPTLRSFPTAPLLSGQSAAGPQRKALPSEMRAFAGHSRKGEAEAAAAAMIADAASTSQFVPRIAAPTTPARTRLEQWMPRVDLGYLRWLGDSKDAAQRAFRGFFFGTAGTTTDDEGGNADSLDDEDQAGVNFQPLKASSKKDTLKAVGASERPDERPSPSGPPLSPQRHTPHLLRASVGDAVESQSRLPSIQTVVIVLISVTLLGAVAAVVVCLVAAWCRGSRTMSYRDWASGTGSGVRGEFLRAREADATPVSVLKRKTPRGIHHSLNNRANSFWWSPLSALSSGRSRRDGGDKRRGGGHETPMFLTQTPGGTESATSAVSIV